MEKKIEKVAVYVRKSREEETDDTLNRQQQVLIDLCERNDWEYELFKEVGSSQDLDREELQKMLKKVSLFYYDAIVVADQDRLSRNVAHFGQIKEVIVNAGCLVVTPTKVFDYSKNEDDFVSDIFSVIAKQEYATIKRRLVRGMRQSAKEGNWVGKKVPIGYKYNRDTKRLEPSEDAQIIKDMFELYAQGLSTKDIALKFTHENVSGLKWSPAGVSRLLSNVVYAGHSLYGKTTQKKVNGKRITKKTDVSEQILVKNTHEPLVSQELFDKVQQLKQARNSRPIPLKLGKRKFSGLIRCGLCGSTHSFQHSRGGKRRINSCQTRIYSEDLTSYKMCPNRGVNLDQFEKLFYMEFSKLRDRLKEHVDLIRQADNGNKFNPEKDIKTKERQISKLQNQIKQVQKGFQLEIYTAEEAQTEIRKLKGQIKALEEQIEHLKEQGKDTEMDFLERTLEKFERFLTAGDNMDERKANEILRELIDQIIYIRTGDQIQIKIIF